MSIPPSHPGADAFPRRVPRSAVRSELRSLIEAPGPYVSLYLDLAASSPADRTEHVLTVLDSLPEVSALQRRAVQAVLECDVGGPDDDVSLLAALVAADGTTVRAAWPDPPKAEIIEITALPRLAPYLEADQMLAHHLVAIIDEGRLDLLAIPRQGEPGSEVLARHDPDEVAAIISQVANDTDTSMVIITGRSPSKEAIADRVRASIPIEVDLLCVPDDPDDDPSHHDDNLGDELVHQVADRSARRIVETMRLFRYHQAHSMTVDGIVDTITAVRAGLVSILMMHDDPADERQAWFGPAFNRIAVDFEDAAPIPSDEPLKAGRLIDVLLRSAIGQDIPCLIIPNVPDERLADGIGAILASDAAEKESMRNLIDR